MKYLNHLFQRRPMAAAAVLAASLFTLPAALAEPVVPFSSGQTLTVFEQTGAIWEAVFPVAEILADGGEFSTGAGEKYTLTSDGTYLTISCRHGGAIPEAELVERISALPEPSGLPFGDLLGHSRGNNIVAVRLDGVPGFPAGLWATEVLDYALGEGGIPESRFNVLGHPLFRGPYGDRHYTVLGSGYSEITLGFSPLVHVRVESGDAVDGPLALYLFFPEDYSPGDVLFHTLELSADGAGPLYPLGWSDVVDRGEDGPALRVEFGREGVEGLLPGGGLLLLRGLLSSGPAFEGRLLLSR